jgi:ferrous-iron efflux pump FieF
MNQDKTIRLEKPPSAPEFNPHLALVAGVASVATSAFLVVIKAAAFMLSGSVSVLASLIDSVVDAGVSAINLMAIRESLKPADKNHRYGHGKIEGLAALMQAAFIAGSGVFLALEAIGRLFDPQPVTAYGVAIIVMLVSSVVSVGLVAVQHRILRTAPSLAVKADREHYASDILVNGGVIAALLLQYFGAPFWIDSAFAFGVGIWLVFIAVRVGKGGIDMLLDRELSKDVREEIKRLVLLDSRIYSLHDLRTRAAGMHIHISFDIEVDPVLPLFQAHEIAKDAETNLLKTFPNAEIMIHVDPLGEPEDARHSVAGVHH